MEFFLAALGAAAVTFVLFPVLKKRPSPASSPSRKDLERQTLADKKEQILASLHDLDFEHAAGKLSEADYEQVRADFMGQATRVMDELQRLAGGATAPTPEPTGAETPGAPAATGATPEEKPEVRKDAYMPDFHPYCIRCGQQNPEGALFCFRCGQRIEILHA